MIMNVDEMVELAGKLANGRKVMKRGLYTNGCWSSVYVTLMQDESGYEAIAVWNMGNVVREKGKNYRKLWSDVRCNALEDLSMSR